jgi:hypothetical protein
VDSELILNKLWFDFRFMKREFVLKPYSPKSYLLNNFWSLPAVLNIKIHGMFPKMKHVDRQNLTLMHSFYALQATNALKNVYFF